MNELIKTNQNDNGEIIVSGRELHEFLEVKTKYMDWFKRMIENGFDENIDFVVILKNEKDETAFGGVRRFTDHAVKLDMAKEISMIQRNEKGKQARQYFLEIERLWNSPEMVMKRAMDYLNAQVAKLQTTNLVLEQQVQELKPKATYYDLVLQNKSLLTVTQIAKDFGMGAKTLNKKLHELGIQYKQGDIWLLYSKYQDKGYTQTHTEVIREDFCKVYTKWTQKGRLFIYETLKQHGILPLIEREAV